MTIWFAVEGKPRSMYVPWLGFRRWRHIAAFARNRYEHGYITILRGMLVLEKW
jgi:hypothetical protein